MRLISCIGILMVIPAVALLTRKYDDPQVNKTPAVIHQSDKNRQLKAKSVVGATSKPQAKTDHASLLGAAHQDFSASSYTPADPSLTK